MAAALRIAPRGPFSLAAAAMFLAGFPPAAREDAAEWNGVLRLALGPDRTCGPLGASLREEDGAVVVGWDGPGDAGAVAARVARVLSLDVDGRGYAAVGRRDPVVRAAHRRRDGLRPVLFGSPFEAGVWAILSQRTRMGQALATRARLVGEYGTVVEAGGRGLAAFPDPAAMIDVPPGPGVTPRRAERLRELDD